MILDIGRLAQPRRIRGIAAATIATAIALSIAGCGGTTKTATPPAPSSANAPLNVVVTFSTLGAIVKDVGGDLVNVNSLVPVGAAPETYEPTPSDLVALSHADLIFENGSGLEAWMDKLLRSAGGDKTPVTLSGLTDPAHAQNPHFWLDPSKASTYAAAIANALERADPRHAEKYRVRLEQTQARYRALDRWIAQKIATVPPSRRVMICFHDAWYYFDKRYGIKDVGAIEPSPGQEPSAGAFAQLIADAKKYHVHAVFAEPQFSPKLAHQLAEGAGITTVSDLYDDTLGTTPALTTYEGLLRFDVERIVEAMRS
ncbi:MAG TPA: metal ABC transporter substrate-binding protein [Candidatus Eremiobacteraceae bacterium]|jgi:zinc/manganese transport system substrate-binding protein